MNWMSADLCGRDVRKIFAPKTVEYKRPRGRPLKYRGYDFDDCEEAQADAYGPDHIQTSWAQIGDGTRQVHAKNADVAVIFTEWATEAWLHGEGGSVRADSTEELVKEWLAVNTSAAASHAASLAPIITRLDPDGSLSLRALAAKLTAEGLPTPAGAAVWTAATLVRVKARLAA
jgi:hypothetical protein